MNTDQLLNAVDPREVVVVVLGGGRGTRLFPLTRDRAKPAVPFGGKYRLIDIPLTNCLYSKFEKIFVLTQFNSFSLNRHIWQAYSPQVQRDGFIEVIAAEQTMERTDWFQGTADAVRQSLRHILTRSPRYVLIISADQIYSMDFLRLLAWHQEHGTKVTICGHYTAPQDILGLGLVKVDADMRVVDFYEKPSSVDDVLDYDLRKTTLDHPEGRPFLCSMGIYLFDTDTLVEALDNDEEDFGKSIIPQTAGRMPMSCFPFSSYWEDVGTIEAFFKANMEWRSGKGISAVFEQGNSIITHSRQLPPSAIHAARIDDSLVADGCNIRADRIEQSIIGVRARIAKGTRISDSLIMGNDSYTNAETYEIGANCRIHRAIIDRNVVIGDDCEIENKKGIEETFTDLYAIRSGIVVIPRDTTIPAGTTI